MRFDNRHAGRVRLGDPLLDRYLEFRGPGPGASGAPILHEDLGSKAHRGAFSLIRWLGSSEDAP